SVGAVLRRSLARLGARVGRGSAGGRSPGGSRAAGPARGDRSARPARSAFEPARARTARALGGSRHRAGGDSRAALRRDAGRARAARGALPCAGAVATPRSRGGARRAWRRGRGRGARMDRRRRRIRGRRRDRHRGSGPDRRARRGAGICGREIARRPDGRSAAPRSRGGGALAPAGRPRIRRRLGSRSPVADRPPGRRRRPEPHAARGRHARARARARRPHAGRPRGGDRRTSPARQPERRTAAGAARAVGSRSRRPRRRARGQRSAARRLTVEFRVESLGIAGGVTHVFAELVRERLGLVYDSARYGQLADRLAPLVVARGLGSLMDYYYVLKYSGDAAEWGRVMDALAIPETYFWREIDQVRAVVDHVVPELVKEARGQTVRIWSVPCSTGEEPLTLAMMLDQRGWFERASIEIL